MKKKLTKSHNRILFGVCAGIAEYFNTDPTFIRILWAILLFAFGTGLLAYIVCAIVMPPAGSK